MRGDTLQPHVLQANFKYFKWGVCICICMQLDRTKQTTFVALPYFTSPSSFIQRPHNNYRVVRLSISPLAESWSHDCCYQHCYHYNSHNSSLLQEQVKRLIAWPLEFPSRPWHWFQYVHMCYPDTTPRFELDLPVDREYRKVREVRKKCADLNFNLKEIQARILYDLHNNEVIDSEKYGSTYVEYMVKYPTLFSSVFKSVLLPTITIGKKWSESTLLNASSLQDSNCSKEASLVTSYTRTHPFEPR